MAKGASVAPLSFMEKITSSRQIHWRHFLMIIIVVGSFALMMSLKTLEQPLEYHNFADRRAFFGFPNFLDVASNLAFLFVGIFGLNICLKNRLGSLRNAWLVLFAGITLVSVGSAYYHWNPNNQTLVWDRLPMTIGFMGIVRRTHRRIHQRTARHISARSDCHHYSHVVLAGRLS